MKELKLKKMKTMKWLTLKKMKTMKRWLNKIQLQPMQLQRKVPPNGTLTCNLCYLVICVLTVEGQHVPLVFADQSSFVNQKKRIIMLCICIFFKAYYPVLRWIKMMRSADSSF